MTALCFAVGRGRVPEGFPGFPLFTGGSTGLGLISTSCIERSQRLISIFEEFRDWLFVDSVNSSFLSPTGITAQGRDTECRLEGLESTSL